MRYPNPQPRPDQRLGRKYRFDDLNMDLFFVSALGWGRSGGLDVGEAFEVASHITDGDADSWIRAFESQANLLNTQADAWAARCWSPAAGEMRLKAFAAYRSSWQFAAPGATFDRLYALHREAFAAAMRELALPATFFDVPYTDKRLPGVFLSDPLVHRPVVSSSAVPTPVSRIFFYRSAEISSSADTPSRWSISRDRAPPPTMACIGSPQPNVRSAQPSMCLRAASAQSRAASLCSV
jgi:hypothetical protein